jgi:hypothetical protein
MKLESRAADDAKGGAGFFEAFTACRAGSALQPLAVNRRADPRRQ